MIRQTPALGSENTNIQVYVLTLLFLIHQVKNNHETNTGIAVENHEYTDSRSHTFISSP